MDKHENKKPPRNTLHVNRWSELPDCVDPHTYQTVKPDGAFSKFTVSKKSRKVLEGLIKQPVACASKCRLSHFVMLLRRDFNLDIEMKMFKGETEGESYGVYFINSKVQRVMESEAA